MNRLTKIRSTIVACVTAIAALIAFAPAAVAADDGDDADGTVTSVRAFPKTENADKDLLAEAVATDVEEDAKWDIEELDVPHTESTAEKEARLAKERREAQEREAAAAASRSQARQKLDAQLAGVASPNSKTAAAVVSYAMQYQGKVRYVYGGNTPAGWDCSGFVQYVFAQVGISLPRTSGNQAAVGAFVGTDLRNAQPGDIIANGGHSGIYLGNGVVINATNAHVNPVEDTAISPVAWVFHGGYQVRRVL